jgi:hypothetical protein
MENKYPAIISDAPNPAAPVIKHNLGSFGEAPVKVAKDMKKKHVTFTADTVNWPVRPQSAFSRDPRNKAYHDPPNGRHPAPLGVEWIDTSRVSGYIADFSNLKVYATRVQAEFDAFLNNSSLRPLSRYKGIVGMHPAVSYISEFVDKFLDGKEATREDMQEMIDGVDALAILLEGGVIKDMLLHDFG